MAYDTLLPVSDAVATSFVQESSQQPEQRGIERKTGRPDSQAISNKPGERSRGGRQGKKRDLGRSAWAKQKTDKRKRNDDQQDAKRRRIDRGETELPIYATKFSEDVLAQEERRPKKKVAVLIGYSGTGYKGMQLTHDQKTIEGDLFQAFVAAGAISKANADDPKKSSFVRCARTDKGVHAAGNVISLKLIVEDDDIVKKINESLNPQIRIWGFERTNNSFSAYQLCDSRIYEYLIPTHSFLPPHPSSYLGRKMNELAEKHGDTDGLNARQEEVYGYWEKVDEMTIKPILNEYDSETRTVLEKALFLRHGDDVEDPYAKASREDEGSQNFHVDDVDADSSEQRVTPDVHEERLPSSNAKTDPESTADPTTITPSSSPVGEGIKRLRAAYILAKRSYRIPPTRLRRISEALALYVGTRNYHNFTVQKTFRDPSSKRVIKSFNLNPDPILINGTEWVSLKVHGQSFMMHQIRKMVGMVALVVRCGCEPKRIVEAYGPENISIPKAPSLGLLLERPVFDSYNKRAKNELGKDMIDFDKFKSEMDDFKQKQIYERMYEDEERDNIFGNFFNHVDNFPSEAFLFVTSGGIEATKASKEDKKAGADKAHLVHMDGDSDSDGGVPLNDANGDEG